MLIVMVRQTVKSSFNNCPFLNGICWDVINDYVLTLEKNKDDENFKEAKDTDDVEIGRFLEDSNFENGEDDCEVVNAWIVLAQIVWLLLSNFVIFVFY